jgi:hypothetical protein
MLYIYTSILDDDNVDEKSNKHLIMMILVRHYSLASKIWSGYRILGKPYYSVWMYVLKITINGVKHEI